MLIGAADVGGDDLEDDGVIDLPAGGIFKFGIVDGLNFDVIWTEKNDSAIRSHKELPSVVEAC
jgi:hypothetical protein